MGRAKLAKDLRTANEKLSDNLSDAIIRYHHERAIELRSTQEATRALQEILLNLRGAGLSDADIHLALHNAGLKPICLVCANPLP